MGGGDVCGQGVRAVPLHRHSGLEPESSLAAAGGLCWQVPLVILLPGVSACGTEVLIPAVAGARHFLCFAKESDQRKATPAGRPSGLPSVGREPRVSLHALGAGLLWGRKVNDNPNGNTNGNTNGKSCVSAMCAQNSRNALWQAVQLSSMAEN